MKSFEVDMAVENKTEVLKILGRVPGLLFGAVVLWLLFSSMAPIVDKYITHQHELIAKLVSECNNGN